MLIYFYLCVGVASLFLLIQSFEFKYLVFSLSDSQFYSTFYFLTGLHGIHVIIGLMTICSILRNHHTLDNLASKSFFRFFNFVPKSFITFFKLALSKISWSFRSMCIKLFFQYKLPSPTLDPSSRYHLDLLQWSFYKQAIYCVIWHKTIKKLVSNFSLKINLNSKFNSLYLLFVAIY